MLIYSQVSNVTGNEPVLWLNIDTLTVDTFIFDVCPAHTQSRNVQSKPILELILR